MRIRDVDHPYPVSLNPIEMRSKVVEADRKMPTAIINSMIAKDREPRSLNSPNPDHRIEGALHKGADQPGAWLHSLGVLDDGVTRASHYASKDPHRARSSRVSQE